MEAKPGTLYLCATPIGNLEDITLRALRVLKEVSEIWAEDTRHTLGLLNHFEIQKPLVSCHAHNVRSRSMELAAKLRGGNSIAYCSDAGMPGISDPGAELVLCCHEEGLPVTVLPGASASLMAVVLSGISTDTFCFYGFLPREKKPRQALLARLAASCETSILYESPLRVPATLGELAALLGERKAALLRELTKLHEECARGTLNELSSRYAQPPKGECVIVVEGKPPEPKKENSDQLPAALDLLLKEGFSTKDAATAAAAILGVQKNKAYQLALERARQE